MANQIESDMYAYQQKLIKLLEWAHKYVHHFKVICKLCKAGIGGLK